MKMVNQFTEQMSKRTNSELLKILNEQRNDYQPEAITAAEEEFSKRNLSQVQVTFAKQELETKKQFDEKRANEPLGVGWKILTAIFPGIIQIIFSGTFKADGYDRKAKELVKWTLYGIGAYIALIIILSILPMFL